MADRQNKSVGNWWRCSDCGYENPSGVSKENKWAGEFAEKNAGTMENWLRTAHLAGQMNRQEMIEALVASHIAAVVSTEGVSALKIIQKRIIDYGAEMMNI